MEGFAAVATMVMINVAMALPAQAVDVKKGYIFGGLTNKSGVLGTVEKKRKGSKRGHLFICKHYCLRHF
jgi:hypothetical protein